MSKFKELMAQARQRETETNDQGEQSVQNPPTNATSASTEDNSSVISPDSASTEAPSSRGRGRPTGSAGGKRSHPDYEQVSAYLPRQTYREVKLALLQNEVTDGAKQEFSTLVAELLSDWLKIQKTK